MNTIKIEDLKFEYTYDSKFSFQNKRLHFRQESEENLINIKDDIYLQFEDDNQRIAFYDSRYLWHTCKNINDVIKVMVFCKQKREENIKIISELKNNRFFKQLNGVDILKTTKAKIYGSKIYMNGIEVILDDVEKTIFEQILSEANWHFANYEDGEVQTITNSLIVSRMFKKYYPEYKSSANNFSITVPYWFKKLFEE